MHAYSQFIFDYCTEGVMDQLCPVDPHLLQEIQDDVCRVPPLCNLTFKALADRLAMELTLPVPAVDIHQACQSYFTIVHYLNNLA